jgi:hypothetical protein
LENAKLSEEKKEIQVTLSKAQEEAASLCGENDLLSWVRDQLSANKALLETNNDKLNVEIEEQSRLISNGAYIAFASCLHGVEGGELLDYDNDPPTQVDLNDPELETFDPHADYSMSPTLAEDEDVAPNEP